jgi:ABC-type cobalt transport system substrate-binding protein
MKKEFTFFTVGMLLLMTSFVSAQYYGGYFGVAEQAIDGMVQNLAPIFQALLGGQDWTGYLLFEKILLFVLFSIIVGLVLEKVPVFTDLKTNHKGILRLIAVIIGIIAVRNLNYIWVGTILVQYQVLFITVAGILPFIIYWFFVSSFNGDSYSWLRKIMWVFYAVIYFGLWMTSEAQTYAEVYLWGAIAAVVYAFFFDSMVHRWLAVMEAKKGNVTKRDVLVGKIKEDIDKLVDQQAKGHISRESAEHAIKIKQKTIESLMKHPK